MSHLQPPGLGPSVNSSQPDGSLSLNLNTPMNLSLGINPSLNSVAQTPQPHTLLFQGSLGRTDSNGGSPRTSASLIRPASLGGASASAASSALDLSKRSQFIGQHSRSSSSQISGLRETKVCVIGDSNVGKTSLALRFVSGIFHELYDPTLGATFLTRTNVIDNVVTKFSIWDTAGQERFKSLTPLYYRDADACVIVFDLTNRNSFVGVSSWIHEVRTHSPPHVLLFLAGNKYDLHDVREVSEEEAVALANQCGCPYIEVSAKTNYQIEKIFEDVGRMLNYHYPLGPVSEVAPDSAVLKRMMKRKAKKSTCC